MDLNDFGTECGNHSRSHDGQRVAVSRLLRSGGRRRAQQSPHSVEGRAIGRLRTVRHHGPAAPRQRL